MPEDSERSIVPQPPRDLTAPQVGGNRILGEMVESSLAVAKTAAFEAEKLDALVREAKRIQGKVSGMTAENVRAFNLFLRAAQAGHPVAQREVAMCFGFGVGVQSNTNESDRWLRLAAEQGDAEAQSMLGMYRSGVDTEAVKWLRKAAEQGHSEAQMTLGGRYSEGKGVPQDYCEAYVWYQLAADAYATDSTVTGAGWVQDQATAVAAFLSAVQLEKAREIYQGFKRKYSAKR